MKKMWLAALSCLSFPIAVSGQNGWLPDAYVPPNYQVCPQDPYKLVFYDNFNGNSLAKPWIKFHSWNNMDYGDTDQWPNGRLINDNVILQDDNIFVDNGTCKLILQYEPTSWKCDTCPGQPISRPFTAGNIALPFNYYDSTTKTSKPFCEFNNGRFEARIKFPTGGKTWAAFWLWKGWLTNEIDIAESYGTRKNWPFLGQKAHAKTSFNIHAWAPPPGHPNPYNVPDDAVRGWDYPNQSWWDWVTGTQWDQSGWNTYTCEWDSTVIRTFLNGNPIHTVWKYNRLKQFMGQSGVGPQPTLYHFLVGSGCNPPTGMYRIQMAYPYNDTSESQLRLGIAPPQGHDGKYPFNMTPPSGAILGTMEIDYVKAWQRKPQPHWKDLCTPDAININGPSIVCGPTSFTASPASLHGYWHRPSQGMKSMFSSNTEISVQPAAGFENFSNGMVSYYTAVPACPDVFVSEAVKIFDIGPPTATKVNCVAVKVSTPSGQENMRIKLAAEPTTFDPAIPAVYNSPHTFDWEVKYGPNASLTYTAQGQYIATPMFFAAPGSTNTVDWKVTITNACGTVVKSGQMTFLGRVKSPNDRSDKNPLHHYYGAEITDGEAYDLAVFDRAGTTFVNETDDDKVLGVVLEKIRMEELAPYIVLDSEVVNTMNQAKKASKSSPYEFIGTNVFPNPVMDNLNIMPGTHFEGGQPISISIYDMLGRKLISKTFSYQSGYILNFNIDKLPAGFYNVELMQVSRKENIKVQKVTH